jgi:uridine kinase
LQFEAINKIADLKIYVHADDDIRLMRKLKRIPKQIKGFLREFDHEERLKFVFHLMDRWSK